jgi:hypothetical protein
MNPNQNEGATGAWCCQWSRYRLVDRDGIPRRLLKMEGKPGDSRQLRLLAADGTLLDEEPTPGGEHPWHFGFWVPENKIGAGRFILEGVRDGANWQLPIAAGLPGAGDAMPLRLDRTGEPLRRHLEEREQLPDARVLADWVPDLAAYLHQHRLIYHQPAAHWGEGLILGNGTVGAVTTGEPWKTQTFYLDRADLWAATPAGRPIGRVYAGWLSLRAQPAGGRGGKRKTEENFLQELSLYRAEVRTDSRQLVTRARVNAVRDVLELEAQWNGAESIRLTLELARPATPLIDEPGVNGAVKNGSWHAILPQASIESTIAKVNRAPHTAPAAEIDGDTAVIRHQFPNMSYALAGRVAGAGVEWRDESVARLACVRGTLTLAPGARVIIRVAVASDMIAVAKQAVDPSGEALRRLDQSATTDAGGFSERDEHANWWRRYWERSFAEFPDKLLENLWYFGVYHQAAFSRSLLASGFFALWHPLDYRTWDDAYVTDAQTSLMWWAPFAVNRLELLLPSHHTFSNLLVEFLEHNPGAGAAVMHMAFPPHAGGHARFGHNIPYKGSVAWYALNFWWDFLYTRDREFLAEIAYPVIAACADYFLGDTLVREADGKLHCLASGAPEQNDTARDNCYDWACIKAVLKAACEAARVLDVDAERAAQWREAWRDLFDCPANAQSLLETLTNPHPYRCHPVVLFGVHPAGAIEPGDALWPKAKAVYEIVTNLLGFHYEDRHAAIPGHTGGVEPNGFAAAFLMHSAARLQGWNEVRRLAYALTARCQLKPNGQRSVCDPRHDEILSHMALSEAASGQTSGLSETLVQNYSDHVRVFAGRPPEGVFRFAGLRAYHGFILAGECAGGLVRSLSVHSLQGGVLRLQNPWPGQAVQAVPGGALRKIALADGSEGLELPAEKNKTYRLTAAAAAGQALPAPAIEVRSEPRAIACGDWDAFDPPVLYYPGDLPFAQPATADGTVFLGKPRVAPEGRPKPPDWDQTVALAGRDDWRARQTAARWLARFAGEDATRLLEKMALTDPVPVVAYTAGVSLVGQGTAAGLAVAFKVARLTPQAHLRREIFKAITRSAHTQPGLALLADCFSGLKNLQVALGAP